MKQTVTEFDFVDAFQKIRPNNFTYDGLIELFNYLEQYEEDCDTEMELDVIAICCDFSEDTIEEALSYYDLDSIEELEERTTVIYVGDLEDYKAPPKDTRIIYQAF